MAGPTIAAIGECCEAEFKAAGVDTVLWLWWSNDDGSECARCGSIPASYADAEFYGSLEDAVNAKADAGPPPSIKLQSPAYQPKLL